MARGDRLHVRIETGFLFSDGRFRQLPVKTRYLYIILWATCIEHARETLPPYVFSAELRDRSTLDTRFIQNNVKRLHDERLLYLHKDKAITVWGVRSKNARLKWKDCKEYSPYGEPTGWLNPIELEENRSEVNKASMFLDREVENIKKMYEVSGGEEQIASTLWKKYNLPPDAVRAYVKKVLAP